MYYMHCWASIGSIVKKAKEVDGGGQGRTYEV